MARNIRVTALQPALYDDYIPKTTCNHELRVRLIRIASREQLPLSALVRRALTVYANSYEKKHNLPPLDKDPHFQGL